VLTRRFALASLVSFVLAGTAGCDDSPHGLSHAQIEQTIKEHGDGLKSCWKATGPHGELHLHVDMTMNPDGHVESAVSTGNDPKVNACLEKQVKTWTFPKVQGTTKFSLPVNFKR
jgi:hypothetical protein